MPTGQSKAIRRRVQSASAAVAVAVTDCIRRLGQLECASADQSITLDNQESEHVPDSAINTVGQSVTTARHMTDQPAVHSLSQEWRQAGVQEGDILLLHSSTRRTLKRLPSLGCIPDPEVILDSFLHALGASGTLLLPLFNFDFTSGTPFDIRNTPSHMGSLTETGRKRVGVVRTGHPVYSFGVLGNGKDLFRRINNFSGYGRDSPFAILHRSGGKIAVLDLPDQHSMTFYHYVEESLNVDYRFHKEFSGSYTDSAGNTSIRTYGIFVRKVNERVVTHVDPMGELLWAKGLYSGHRPGSGSGLRVIRSQAMYNEVANVIGAGKARGLLYEIQ